jgi:DNA helicase-2/ATP-dependent DNA helicase PcrA
MDMDINSPELDWIKRQLNPEQLEVLKAIVAADDQIVLKLIATPGSGKTRTATMIYLYMICKGLIMDKSSYLITFTKKAAEELSERVKLFYINAMAECYQLDAEFCQETASSMVANITTLHSLGAKILRSSVNYSGYNIIDTSDQSKLIKNILKSSNEKLELTPGQIGKIISSWKVGLSSPNDDTSEKLIQVYEEYQRQLQRQKLIDYDDLLIIPNKLLDDQEFREFWQRKIELMFVDEAQDLSKLQLQLVHKLSQNAKYILFVGDPQQSIYGFRGSVPNLFNEINKLYKEAQEAHLVRNYRSDKDIIDAANKLMQQYNKETPAILPVKKNKGEVTVIRFSDDYEEADYVVEQINWLLTKKGYQYRDIAIISRTHAVPVQITKLLKQKGIPYSIVGGFQFLERKSIKDVLGYLRCADNPYPDFILQIINTPTRGIGKKTLAAIQLAAENSGLDLWDFLLKFRDNQSLVEKINNATYINFINFVDIITHLQNKKMVISESISYVLEATGYLADSKEKNDESETLSEEYVAQLLEITRQYEKAASDPTSYQEFNGYLLTTYNAEENENKGLTNNSVSIITAHSVKGKEYPVGILTGCDEGILPHVRAGGGKPTSSDQMLVKSAVVDEEDSSSSIAEELRIFYVMITRAEKILIISSAKRRLLYGKTYTYEPSRFLSDLGIPMKDLSEDEEIDF